MVQEAALNGQKTLDKYTSKVIKSLGCTLTMTLKIDRYPTKGLTTNKLLIKFTFIY